MTKGADDTSHRAVLPAGAAPAGLIVCERTGRWAVALRRELAGAGVRLEETRSLVEAWDVLRRRPASFLIAELTRDNVDSLLARLGRMERDFPLARMAVVAEREFSGSQWLMREAGAAWFAVSPREAGPLAHAIARHLDQAPAPQLPLAEQVWAELPWGPDT